MAVIPAAASREATKYAGLRAEVDGEGAGDASHAVCGHYARHSLHEAIAASAHGAAPCMRQLVATCRKLSGLLLSTLAWLPTKAQCITSPQSEARPLYVLQCGLAVVQPHEQSASEPSSGLHSDNKITSGMPTPKLMSWLG